ncbi:aromatic compound dioxygenase [Xylariaceae sp. FL0016]|nr:aromatic compound dioxygenase [Xylariaceae sp. FL0016]
MRVTASFVSLGLVVGYVAAHVSNFATELARRGNFLEAHGSSLTQARDSCAEDITTGDEYRKRMARDLSIDHGIVERAYSDYNHSHISGDGWNVNTDPHDIFNKHPSCALSPDVTEGPFYVEGELVRSNITDGQAGIPLHLKLRIKDFVTCKDVSDVYVEVWHSNATGTYGGTGSEHGKTFCRGLQKTDSMGVASFDTIFPGHYGGRAPHIHVAVHTSDTVKKTDGSVHHHAVSMNAQVFFDQGLIGEVETVSPYSTNHQPFTKNDDDGFLMQEAAAAFDPFVAFLKLSANPYDGLLAWITLGANMTEHRDLSVADTRP